MAPLLSRWFRTLLALGLLAAAWAVFGEPQCLVVRHEDRALAGWTGTPLRVALVSDLHVGSPFAGVDKVRRVADAVTAEHPDVVLLLGDYAINAIPGGEKVPPDAWAPVVGAIPAPLGVYAVLGNHDWWNDEGAIRRALRHAGVHLMDNNALPVRRGADRVWLVGVGDSWTDHADPDTAFAPVEAGEPAVAFGHEPDIVDGVGRRARVVFAGHTHGGQVYVPWLSDALLRLRFRRGWYDVAGVPLYVTSGVGMSVYPVRLGVPPEVVIVTLHGEAGQGRSAHPNAE